MPAPLSQWHAVVGQLLIVGEDGGHACSLVARTQGPGATSLAVGFKMRMQCLQRLLAGLQVNHEDFNEGIVQVQSKKKANLNYYA